MTKKATKTKKRTRNPLAAFWRAMARRRLDATIAKIERELERCQKRARQARKMIPKLRAHRARLGH